MAATDPNPRSERHAPSVAECLTPLALRMRVEEEIGRAERHGTGLSCLLVAIENLDALAHEHGAELREQTLEYVAGTLTREMRRFDRVGRPWRGSNDGDSDLVIVLPGADSPRAEIVARRTLDRLRTIKIEADGTREPLEISVGLAAWRQELSAEALLAHARAALRSVNGDHGYPAPHGAPTPDGAPNAAGEHEPQGPAQTDTGASSAVRPAGSA
jgi:diguanylate cyclase (GGDEF)-like protein